MKQEALAQALGASVSLVNDYAGSDASRAVVGLLDVLILHYGAELEVVETSGLEKLQGQVAQCRRLRDVLNGVAHADPRI